MSHGLYLTLQISTDVQPVFVWSQCASMYDFMLVSSVILHDLVLEMYWHFSRELRVILVPAVVTCFCFLQTFSRLF